MNALLDAFRKRGSALAHALYRDHPDTSWCGGCEEVRQEIERYQRDPRASEFAHLANIGTGAARSIPTGRENR